MTTNPLLIHTEAREVLIDRAVDALHEMAERILTEHPHRAADMDRWLATVDRRLLFTATVDSDYNPESLTFHVLLNTAAGIAPLASVPASDLPISAHSVVWDFNPTRCKVIDSDDE